MFFDVTRLPEREIVSAVRQQFKQRDIDLSPTDGIEVLASLLGYANQTQWRTRPFKLDDPALDFLNLAFPHYAILDQYLADKRTRELPRLAALSVDVRRDIVSAFAVDLRQRWPEYVFYTGYDFADAVVLPKYMPLIARSEAVNAVTLETGEPADILIERQLIDLDLGPSIRKKSEAVWVMQFGGLLGRANVDHGEEANLAQVMFRATFEFPKVGPALIKDEPSVLVDAWSHYPRDYRSEPRNPPTHTAVL